MKNPRTGDGGYRRYSGGSPGGRLLEAAMLPEKYCSGHATDSPFDQPVDTGRILDHFAGRKMVQASPTSMS